MSNTLIIAKKIPSPRIVVKKIPSPRLIVMKKIPSPTILVAKKISRMVCKKKTTPRTLEKKKAGVLTIQRCRDKRFRGCLLAYLIASTYNPAIKDYDVNVSEVNINVSL